MVAKSKCKLNRILNAKKCLKIPKLNYSLFEIMLCFVMSVKCMKENNKEGGLFNTNMPGPLQRKT